MMPWIRCPATDIMMTSYSSHQQCAASLAWFTGYMRRWGKSSVRRKEHFHLLSLFPQLLSGKECACPAGDVGLILGSGRSPGEGNGNSLQYSCLGNPMDRGAWWATVHGVTKEVDTTLATEHKEEEGNVSSTRSLIIKTSCLNFFTYKIVIFCFRRWEVCEKV